MLLFQKRFHEGLKRGQVRLTFRTWDKPHVRAGGRYRCHPIGVLEVDRIDRVRVAEIGEADALLAGFASRAELVAYLAENRPVAEDTELYRVELHHGGDGDRVALALAADLGAEDVDAIRGRLERLDRSGGDGRPWTRRTLELIEKRPRIAASRLAAHLGRDTLPFKVDVRKLKRLGLTQSFEVGYELSPRGRAYLAAVRASRTRRVKARARTPARGSGDAGGRRPGGRPGNRCRARQRFHGMAVARSW
jgi:hypothetical protein